MSKRLVSIEVCVTILSDLSQSDIVEEKIDGIIVKRTNNFMLGPLIGKKKFKKALLENKPDLIIWYGTPLSSLFLSNFASIRKPIIWDLERNLTGLELFKNISFQEILNPHHRFLWQDMLTAFLPRILFKSVANSAFISKIIVPSASLKAKLTKNGVEKTKIVVIGSTFERETIDFLLSEEKPADLLQTEIGLTHSNFIVSYFGSPCTLRGTDTAIIGLKKLLLKRKKVNLLIFSRRQLISSTSNDENLREEEELLIRLIRKNGLEEHVKIIPGMLERSKVQQYFLASDAIILPFKILLSEPPLAVLEAMHMKKVVITTNLGSLSEIVSKNRGILIEPKNPEQLANAIQFLIDHPEQSEQISRNGQRYSDEFPTWNEITTQFMDLLNKIHKETGDSS